MIPIARREFIEFRDIAHFVQNDSASNWIKNDTEPVDLPPAVQTWSGLVNVSFGRFLHTKTEKIFGTLRTLCRMVLLRTGFKIVLYSPEPIDLPPAVQTWSGLVNVSFGRFLHTKT